MSTPPQPSLLSPLGSPLTPPLPPPHPKKDAALHLLCLAAENTLSPNTSAHLAAAAAHLPGPPPPPHGHGHASLPPPPTLRRPPPTMPLYLPPQTFAQGGGYGTTPFVAYSPMPYAPMPMPLVSVAPMGFDGGVYGMSQGVRKVKGPWRPEEDKILKSLVKRMGPRRWSVIASHIPGRTGKQARERWLNQLSPDLEKRAWTEEEDRVVMEAHRRLGNRWSEIAKLLKGRTDNATKNRFNTTIRRQISEMSREQRQGGGVGEDEGKNDRGVGKKRKMEETKEVGKRRRIEE